VWGSSVVTALLGDTAPERLDTYSTPVTYALDVGLIAPAVLTAGVLVRRGNPLGFRMAVPLLILEALLAPLITAQTIVQLSAGISFPPGQIIGPMAGFAVLAVAALWFIPSAMHAVAARPDTPEGAAR
jgi:hypothetical protein